MSLHILKSILLVFIISSISVTIHAQKLVGEVTDAEKKNFETVQKAVAWLKKQPTPVMTHAKAFKKGKGTFLYDSLFQLFFDPIYTDRKNIRPGKEELGLTYAILYNIDHFLDFLPADSIFLTPFRHLDIYPDNPDETDQNSLITYYLIGGKKFIVHQLSFNKDAELLMINAYLDFERLNKGIDIVGFYTRQKGYAEIQPKLFKFEAED